MKTLLLFLFTAAMAHAQFATAIITADTKLELTKGKGTIVLKAGTKVDVTGQEGDSLAVVYRSIQGLVPLAKTDFKGEPPKGNTGTFKEETKENVTVSVVTPPPAAKPLAPKPADPKPAEVKPATPSPAAVREPTTTYGKAVKKARDNTATHKETMVDPTNELTGADKK